MRFENPRPRNDEERVLPLINVVFLLLIFFMVAGRLAPSDPFPIEPPPTANGEAAEVRDMLVLVAADGRLALDGEVLAEAALEAAVAGRLAEQAATEVRLKADGGAEAVRVVEVMELLRDAGVEGLRLLTVPVEGL